MVHLNTFYFIGKTPPACLMNTFALGAGGVTVGRHNSYNSVMFLLELVLLSGVVCPQCLMLVGSR